MTVALASSPTSGLVFHSAILGGINGRRFDDFLSQTRLNLDPDEHVIFIYDGEPTHRNSAIPGPNSELRKLPPYSPFLNIVEQDVSALKAAIKADTSRPETQVQMNDRAEARRQGLALENYRKQLLLQALQRNIGTITVAKCGQWFRFMQVYGIPQGSVLGPTLFSLYTSDLPEATTSAISYMYADDTTLYCIGDSIDVVICELNKALEELLHWCKTNSLAPHPKKCEAMILHRGRFTGPLKELTLAQHTIKWVTHSRLLGVLIELILTC